MVRNVGRIRVPLHDAAVEPPLHEIGAPEETERVAVRQVLGRVDAREVRPLMCLVAVVCTNTDLVLVRPAPAPDPTRTVPWKPIVSEASLLLESSPMNAVLVLTWSEEPGKRRATMVKFPHTNSGFHVMTRDRCCRPAL